MDTDHEELFHKYFNDVIREVGILEIIYIFLQERLFFRMQEG